MRLFRLMYVEKSGRADQWELYDSLDALREGIKHGDFRDKPRESLVVEEIEADHLNLYLAEEEEDDVA